LHRFDGFVKLRLQLADGLQILVLLMRDDLEVFDIGGDALVIVGRVCCAAPILFTYSPKLRSRSSETRCARPDLFAIVRTPSTDAAMPSCIWYWLRPTSFMALRARRTVR
jgi:hypothetical protein